jgi:hypothetical protein
MGAVRRSRAGVIDALAHAGLGDRADGLGDGGASAVAAAQAVSAEVPRLKPRVARRRSVHLADLSSRVLLVDQRTGTTTAAAPPGTGTRSER